MYFRLFYPKYQEEIKENIDEVVKSYDDMLNSIYENENTETIADDLNLQEKYKEYPAGTTYLMYQFSIMWSYGYTIINSFIIGAIVGTAIYLMLNSKDKKGIKLVIALYILSVIILGFFQGIYQVAGENLTILDYLVFPDEYIIPVTIAFGLVVAVRFIRQKGIAQKLNEKLKEKKNIKEK